VPFVFFTDRDLGQRFPDTLKTAGIAVERHGDHFRDDIARKRRPTGRVEHWLPSRL
jgi:hypothetical protein